MADDGVRKLRHPGQLISGPKPLVIHASEDWHDKILGGEIDFFAKIAERARHHGHKVLLTPAGTLLSRATLETDARQIAIGKQRVARSGLWHAHPAYLWGFWYLDPGGYYWTSSIADQTFAPETVDAAQARWFFNGVTGHMLRENVSKLPQPARGAALPPAAAVVFLQQIDGFRTPVHYVDTLQMIERTARAAAGARVYVKPHPVQSTETLAAVTALCATLPNVLCTDANLHDLIAVSDVTVTQNSAAGFEALMQCKPVVTCARIDYHHATLVARDGDALEAAVREAPGALAGFAYDRYLYWFLHDQMLEPQQAEFSDRAWARILRTDTTV